MSPVVSREEVGAQRAVSIYRKKESARNGMCPGGLELKSPIQKEMQCLEDGGEVLSRESRVF